MKIFNDADKRAKVLVLDTNATPLTTSANPPLKIALAACQRMGCLYDHVNYADITDEHYSTDYDMILVPVITNADTGFTNLQAAAGKFHNTTIPIAVMGAAGPAGTGTRQGITGALTDAAASAVLCNTFTNWQGRTIGGLAVYGEHALTLNSSAKAVASDGTNISVWQFNIGSHPTLWIAGYTSSHTNSSVHHPWLCFQWMIDQVSSTRKSEILTSFIKSYCLLRMDGFDSNNDQTAYDSGALQAWYSACQSAQLKEIWQSCVGQGAANPGATNPTVAQWYAVRNENKGGLFRAMNHHTDVVDNTGGTGPAASTDGAAFDNYIAAGRAYEADCDILTGTFGMKLGSDGYGKGYPIVMNGNDMNNPAAMFLSGDKSAYRVYDSTDGKYYGGYGCHLMLEESETYPNGSLASTESIKVNLRNHEQWYDGYTIPFVNDLDTAWSSANTGAITYNGGMIKAFLYSSGVYIHPLQADDFTNYAPHYGGIFQMCPDVFSSGTWEDLLASIPNRRRALLSL